MLKTALRVAFALNVGTAAYIGYKSIKKSQPKKPILTYTQTDDLRDEKNKVMYNLKTRDDHIKEAKDGEYDVLIIGGGCNGAGVLLDAAARGLKCLLIEDQDFASGTSSKSTKLIHGGVRYLEQAFSWNQTERLEKISLVAEALKDRSYMIQNAQYLNKPLPIIIPSTNVFWAGYYYAGVFLYQLIYTVFDDERNQNLIPFPYIIARQELKKIYPALDNQFNYGVVYYDGQTNDSRMNIDVILTSTLNNYIKNEKMNPANALNYTRFLDFIKDEKGKIIGAELLDKVTNQKFQVKTKVAVNCTGAFADEIRKKDDPKIPARIVPALGSHLTLEKKLSNKKYGLLIPKTSDGRVLFVLPWQDHTVVGTTDILKEKPELDPTVSFDEILFMTKEVSTLFPNIKPSDITDSVKSKWAGIRPLVKTKLDEPEGTKVNTKDLARTHVIETTKSGLISLMGGKWTIYRQMGEDTVNEILKYFKENDISVTNVKNETLTKELRLLGQFRKNYGPLNSVEKKAIKMEVINFLNQRYKLSQDVSRHLIKTYGERVFDLAKLFNDPKNSEKLCKNHPFTVGELRYNIRYEMAIDPTDFIFRRTRMGFVDSEAIFEALPRIIDIFAEEYKWDEKRKQAEFKESIPKIKKLNF